MKRKTRFLLLLAAALGLGALPDAQAGLININLTDTMVTGTGADGTAILGGGTWNRIGWTDAGLATALVDSGAKPLAGVTAMDAAFPAGLSQANGNAVQNESWVSDVDLTVSGLTPNLVYKVAVYSDRIGSGAVGPDTYTVNGTGKTLPKPGAAVTPLPGVENVDYALYIVNASATGTITIQAPVIAGIQIEGVLPGEAGPQADARISDRASKAGKGGGKYAAKPRKFQTLTQDTKGKRPRRYFVGVDNDGGEIDRFFLSGGWSRKKVKVKVVDLGSGANVTASAMTGNYRYLLEKGESRQFKIVAKPKKKKPGKLKVRMTASPSTRAVSRTDVVVGLTNVAR